MKQCCKEWNIFKKQVEDERFRWCPHCRLHLDGEPTCFPYWSAWEEQEIRAHWKTETSAKIASRFPYRRRGAVTDKMKNMRWSDKQGRKKER